MNQEIDRVAVLGSAVLGRQLPAVRAQLDEQRRFRLEQLQELAADVEKGFTTGDRSRLHVSQALQVAAEAALAEIEAALRRLDQGTYGNCEQCTQLIPWERLEVLPMTRLCTPCHWATERPTRTPSAPERHR